jgi:hypothetical protein
MTNKSRAAQWYMHTLGEPGPAGPSIPTLGHPTSANELFRVAALHSTGHEGWNSCFTDFTAPAALARIVEGEVKSIDDLRAAEVALQSLMWHDRVDVLVPSFHSMHDGFTGYSRENDPRTQLAFELFDSAAAYDQLFVVETVQVADGRVARSNIQGSGIVGLALDQAKDSYLHNSPYQAAALSSIPLDFGVPAYFTHPLLRPHAGKRGGFGEFYTAVARDWDEAMRAVPDVAEVIPVPPLLAIVLDRVTTRSDIPAVIRALRDELEPIRAEMLGFSDMLRGAYNQVQIEQKCSSIRASFAATFKASRLSEQPFILPLLKLYKTAKSPLDPLIAALNPDYVPGDPRVVADHTLTSSTFARLLRVDAMHSLLAAILTDAEIRSLGTSASANRKA